MFSSSPISLSKNRSLSPPSVTASNLTSSLVAASPYRPITSVDEHRVAAPKHQDVPPRPLHAGLGEARRDVAPLRVPFVALRVAPRLGLGVLVLPVRPAVPGTPAGASAMVAYISL